VTLRLRHGGDGQPVLLLHGSQDSAPILQNADPAKRRHLQANR
jgi:hypothetical protein